MYSYVKEMNSKLDFKIMCYNKDYPMLITYTRKSIDRSLPCASTSNQKIHMAI